jgi:hypothetical protein
MVIAPYTAVHLVLMLEFTKAMCTTSPVSQALQIGSTKAKADCASTSKAPSQPRPSPSSTVPFRRDPDFVDRDILAEIEQKCSRPASRTALVGLGGVG